MLQVNIQEEKIDYPELIFLVESGREDFITVVRNGKPIVKIVPATDSSVSKRIGVAKGKFKAPDDFDLAGEEAAAMLMESNL